MISPFAPTNSLACQYAVTLVCMESVNIQTFLDSLRANTFSAQLLALDRLCRTLQESDSIRAQFAGSDLASILVSLLRSTSVQVPQKAALAVSYYAADDSGRLELLQQNVLPVLESFIDTSNTNMVYTCITAIYNLTLADEAAILHMQPQRIERILRLCQHEDTEIADFASGVIFNCGNNFDFCVSLINGPYWANVLGLIKSRNAEVRHQVIRFVLKSMTKEKVRSTIPNSLVLASILETLEETNPAVQAIVLKSLLVLVSVESFRRQFASMGGIRRVIDVLGNCNDAVQQIGALVIVNLAVDANVRSTIKQLGGISMLYSFLLSANIEVKRNALWALANLSQDEENCRAICDGGVGTLLLKQLKSFVQESKKHSLSSSLPSATEFEIALDVLKTLANMAADVSCSDFLLDQNALALLSECLEISAYNLSETYADVIELACLCLSNICLHEIGRKEFVSIIESYVSVGCCAAKQLPQKLVHYYRAMRNASIEELACEEMIAKGALMLLQFALGDESVASPDAKRQSEFAVKNMRRFWKLAHLVDSARMLSPENIAKEIETRTIIFETQMMLKLTEAPKVKSRRARFQPVQEAASVSSATSALAELEQMVPPTHSAEATKPSEQLNSLDEFDSMFADILGSAPPPPADKRKSVKFSFDSVGKSNMDSLVGEAMRIIEAKSVPTIPEASKRASVSVSARLSIRNVDSTPLNVQIQAMRETLKKVEAPPVKEVAKKKTTYMNIAAIGTFAAAMARRRSRMKEYSSDEDEQSDDDW